MLLLPSSPGPAPQFSDNERMVRTNKSIGCAKWEPTACTVGGDQSIKRVTCPGETKRVPGEREERDFIDDEPLISQDLVGKFRITNLNPTDFSKILDHKERNRRDPPRSIALKPRELGKPARL